MNMLNCNQFICQIDEFSHNQTCTINYRFAPILECIWHIKKWRNRYGKPTMYSIIKLIK
ncbi:hypothetical protein QNG98_gp03 [Yersinia phage PYps3T]|uniref:Uncharacterized protein n=1 Tax=Yersinia phage PYps3T TaxID=2801357 RepID=A0AAE7P414_9CAUD|nr:hypothetical protein QNG98_gp03 [Yersinia phage PYps3T]QQO91005.1 hypothetical protein ORF003 [Yersinia phage PYps3T]QQO91090.1 hypothetical protein ORF003 [Yersinia phage PYps4T]QQO91260.1 hypothetical protein ORF003 [Yersinia phage PYps16T]